jgi:hypothetical protein
MKTKRSFTMVLTAVLAIAVMSTAAGAAPGPSSKGCSLVGTWSGWADHTWPNSSMAWLAVQTADNATKGEILMNWVFVRSELLSFGEVVASHLTPGHGVWEQTANGQYKYTWYAYGIDADGNPVFSVRVSGVVTTTDCNNVSITYAYEVFAGQVAPQDMSSENAIYGTGGEAGETRVPLVTVTE